jgi:hypothetical protein
MDLLMAELVEIVDVKAGTLLLPQVKRSPVNVDHM